MLEDTRRDELTEERTLFRHTILPDLSRNIRCGNSLIGPDFSLFNKVEEHLEIRAFDWRSEFREVMASGGFDAVIGNPPYVLLQVLSQPPVFDYLSANYRAAKYKIDTYQVFMEKGLNLTTPGGYFGFITPSTYLRNKYALELRRLILEKAEVKLLRVFYYSVFAGASVDTAIAIMKRTEHPNPGNRTTVIRSSGPDDVTEGAVSARVWLQHPEVQFALAGDEATVRLLAKMRESSVSLGEFATAYFGIQTFDRGQFVKTKPVTARFRPVIDGTNISRYALAPAVEYVDFRDEAIKSGGDPAVYAQERIGVRQIGRSPIATRIPPDIYTLNTVYNIYFTKQTAYSLRFVLGVICAKALAWYWEQFFFDQKETFPKIKKDALLAVPIPRIDFSRPVQKARHDKTVSLVERMLDLHKQLPKARTDLEKTAIERQIQAADQQIDTLVYGLYGLTEDEIRIVEGGQR
jgi:hypothetical protein